MPTYEYACRKCGHQWEAIQRISEDPLKECPECAQPAAERQISAGTNFILKGGGWYADLYSSGGAKKKEDASAAPATTPATTTPSTPAKTTEPSTSAPAPAAPAKTSSGSGSGSST
jgi:putative FmdB family regulatory protein